MIKSKIDRTIKGELQIIQDKSAIQAEFIPASENEFTVKCKIIENDASIFEIQTLATSREQAMKMVKNWEENTAEIYPKVLELLNEERIEEKKEESNGRE